MVAFGRSVADVALLQNRLANGNFAAIRRTLVVVPPGAADAGHNLGLTSQVHTAWVDDGSAAVDLTAAGTPYAGAWEITGQGGKVDVDPVLPDGHQLLSSDSGHLLRVALGAKGSATVAQTLEDIEPFRGQAITLALSGVNIKGAASVQVRVNFGVSAAIWKVSSASFGDYRRLTFNTIAPVNLTTVRVELVLTGTNVEVGLSGVTLLLGVVTGGVPYVDSLADVLLPSGAVLLVTGEACPAGYVLDEDMLGALLLGVPADALSLAAAEESRTIGSEEHRHLYDGANPAVDANAPDLPYTRSSAPTDITAARIFTQYAPSTTQADWADRPDVESILTGNHTHDVTFKGTSTPPFIGYLPCRKI